MFETTTWNTIFKQRIGLTGQTLVSQKKFTPPKKTHRSVVLKLETSVFRRVQGLLGHWLTLVSTDFGVKPCMFLEYHSRVNLG